MAGATSIEWTDVTWNPTTGCTKVSNGCEFCYAETIAKRFQHDGPFVPWTVAAQRKALPQEGVPAEAGYQPITLHPDRLDTPLHWQKPRRVFVNSMSDLFHETVPFSFIDEVFAVMYWGRQHTFQILTKRPQRMLEYFDYVTLAGDTKSRVMGFVAGEVALGVAHAHPSPWRWPLPNVWLGVSVENQRYAEERIPLLLQTPAAVRFISAEPLLAPVDFRKWLKDRPASAPLTNWVIVGGESGPYARPMELAWARDIVRQCKEAGVACFVKQLGASPVEWGAASPLRDRKGGAMAEWPEDLRVREYPAVEEA